MDVEKIPKPKNRYNAQFQYELWNAFEEGSNARAKLLAEQGYRPVPSEDELHKEVLEVLGSDSAEEGIKEFRHRLLEGDSAGT